MPSIKLTIDEMNYIALFESVTGAVTKDCIIDENNDRIIFIVRQGDMGLAIGKGGINVKRLKNILNKNIEVVEYAEDPETLIKHALAPARVKSVKIMKTPDGQKTAYVTVEPQDKGIAIGKDGKNILKAKLIAKRYFDIEKIVML
ncbi:MAG: NusA-like transcription termination signal-binding factor [archaeon YNP-LCB-003-016]|uniref:NusA-like transcription termination signal-binding factor n=1 Tax=Candidatus Culexarchaeum yellowstonense TaxID=2928963 RepID=UPI0029D7A022|nr:NusA-like transcription termination signal-binding factor [Candidatus Verstraetearchaeota archaeon]MCR6668604.1 NusA-like transcription termination signal-binding factor [Candidatus Culexarchaeum yellowstonense]MCR6690822.1 NusA-like transcription termination signal-binding factor [Candidatus Culexarchaeum yellowstonense]